MEAEEKKRGAILGIRIGFLYLTVFGILVLAAFYILSQSFEEMLTSYTITLVQTMVEQGVTTVESQLQAGREEVKTLAAYFSRPEKGTRYAAFPDKISESDILRMVYISGDGTVASDGRRRDLRGREDIIRAFNGEKTVYGPYYNGENEYVICYSVPVYQNGEIYGVFSIEKSGYSFSELIGNIQFADTGEAYIINEEGTDIAVSRKEHINWVEEGYNAGRLLETQEDQDAGSVLALENKGLAGESGIGTYEWEGSLCYVVYEPIPSTGWVLLAGLRREEIVSMMRSVLYSSLIKGPVPIVCVTVFLFLTAIIIYWIIRSMKKSAEINERLKIIANYDSLTGIMNRNSYHDAVDKLKFGKCRTLGCVYVDVNGLHEINNHLGHHAGDKMLITVADVLRGTFTKSDIYRIGGDEFVVICRNKGEQDICDRAVLARQKLKEQGYEISVGIGWMDLQPDISVIVNQAEEAMQQDKKRYYQDNGKERQLRLLNREVEQMMLEKQDADTFLSVLAPEFKGVYFVDMSRNTIRHLFIPSYFEEILREAGDIFSEALLLYARRIVSLKYREQFIKFCDYSSLRMQLSGNAAPEFIYEKTDGTWIRLRILKFKNYTDKSRETLWIFEDAESIEQRLCSP